MAGVLGLERGALVGETGAGRLGVAVEGGLALAVGGELGDLGVEAGDLAAGGVEVAVEAVALEGQALEEGAGDGVLVAEGGQALLGGGAEARGLGGGGLRLAGGAGGLGERRGGGGAGGLGVVPVAPDEEALGAAQRLGDLAVALGLAGLAGEAGELGVEGFEHVGDAGEVGLGRPELELGLVAALVEAGDAGGLLEDAAAGLGPGVDQLGDLALADEGRRLGAGRGVGEEHGDVAGAGLLARHLVGRAGVAGDAADDGQVVVVVEAGGGAAVAVVDGQGDFGVVAGRARAGAGEDHVVHAVAAHRRRAVLAHHPAQGLEQVRLAAAVRPDDARQPLVDHELGRVDEALEAEEAQAGELQGAALLLAVANRFRRGAGFVNSIV